MVITESKASCRETVYFFVFYHILVQIRQNVSYGQISDKSTGINEYDFFFGFNGEEYNPVTDTQYLRARYYALDTGSFLSQDSVLGSVSNLNSQNRYAFAENDPINNIDPSGHAAVVNYAYARNMAANGSIDEILNMSVAGALSQWESKANTAFYGQLYRAHGVSYQDIDAINSISGISQATANYYIQNGGLAALRAAINLNCVPGEIVNGTIRMFETNVNATKDSVNVQIAQVKSNKKTEYDNWQAWLAEQERLLSDPYAFANKLRDEYGIYGPQSAEWVIANYGARYAQDNGLSGFLNAGSLTGYLGNLVDLIQKGTAYYFDGFNVMLSQNNSAYAVIKGARSFSAYSNGIGGTRYLASSPAVSSFVQPGAAVKSALSGNTISSKLGLAGVALNVGSNFINNIQNGASGQKIAADAVVDTAVGLGNIAISAAVGAAWGSFIPGPGNLIGAGIGLIVGIGLAIAENAPIFGRKSPIDMAKEGLTNVFSGITGLLLK